MTPIDRTCPSCRMRHRVPAPTWLAEYYNAIEVDPNIIRFLLHAAATFDSESAERYTAREFVEWMLPDLKGGPSYPDSVGAKPKTEAAGKDTHKHRHPDPIPVVSLPEILRRVVG